jgi:hypothetical protein
MWNYGIAFRHESNSDEIHHWFLIKDSLMIQLVTINFTLFGLSETEGYPFERF